MSIPSFIEKAGFLFNTLFKHIFGLLSNDRLSSTFCRLTGFKALFLCDIIGYVLWYAICLKTRSRVYMSTP